MPYCSLSFPLLSNSGHRTRLPEKPYGHSLIYGKNPAMDSLETADKEEEGKQVRRNAWLRCFVSLLFSLVALLSLAFMLGFPGDLWVPNPISVPSQCKIVSSSVDLRSSKVCDLGLLNYKGTDVFYHVERKKFRCHYDYYWASIFKVEYKDRLGQTRLALVEEPNEALSPRCRPTFSVAWLTKDKFKVNETYDCWYTFGVSNVNIHHDNFFNCQAKSPSIVEMIRRYLILYTRIVENSDARRERAWYWKWEAVAGVVMGFSTSLIFIALIKILQQAKSCLPNSTAVRPPASLAARLKQACLFAAYFSFIGWLAIQYGKIFGFPDIAGVR